MSTKRLLGLLVVLWVLPGIVGAAAAKKLQQVVPRDAAFMLRVSDATELRTDWGKTALARFWKDPAVQQFTAPMRAEISRGWQEMKQEADIPDDWLSYLPGEIVLFAAPLVIEPGAYEIPFCFAAQTGLPQERYLELINKYIETFPPDATKRQYEVQGVTVRMVESRKEKPTMPGGQQPPGPGQPAPAAAPGPDTLPVYFQYAFTDNVLLLTDGNEDVMRGMVRRLKAAPAETVADVSSLKRVQGLLPAEGHITAYAAADQFINMVLASVKQAGLGNPQMFNPQGLGLEGIKGLALGFHLGEKQVTTAMALDLPPQGRGVVGMLRQFRPSPQASLAATPASAVSYSTMGVDWAGLWKEFRATLRATSPMFDGMASMSIQGYESQLGVKIVDALGALGPELGYFISLAPGPSDEARYTFMVAVENKQIVQQTLEKILTTLQAQMQQFVQLKMESTEFLGQSIRTVSMRPTAAADPGVPPGGEMPTLSWVVTDDFLVISASLDSIKEVLQLKAGKREDSLAASDAYRKARALLPEKLDGFEFARTEAFSELVLGQFLEIARQPQMAPVFGEAFNMSAPLNPETASRYFGIAASGMQIDPNGFAWMSVMSSAAE